MLGFFVKEPPREMMDWPVMKLVVVTILFAPVIETLLLQAIPISLARVFKAGIKIQIAISTVIFAALHFPEGIGVGIGAGVIGGLYFAYAYAHWAKKSFWTAMWVTIVAHLIRNAVAISILIVCRPGM